MHQFLKFIFGIKLYMFWTVSLSIVRSTCPKHVQFYPKNKFEKLVHLVGFIIRIYHDARSSHCQISPLVFFGRGYFAVLMYYSRKSENSGRVHNRSHC